MARVTPKPGPAQGPLSKQEFASLKFRVFNQVAANRALPPHAARLVIAVAVSRCQEQQLGLDVSRAPRRAVRRRAAMRNPDHQGTRQIRTSGDKAARAASPKPLSPDAGRGFQMYARTYI